MKKHTTIANLRRVLLTLRVSPNWAAPQFRYCQTKQTTAHKTRNTLTTNNECLRNNADNESVQIRQQAQSSGRARQRNVEGLQKIVATRNGKHLQTDTPQSITLTHNCCSFNSRLRLGIDFNGLACNCIRSTVIWSFNELEVDSYVKDLQFFQNLETIRCFSESIVADLYNEINLCFRT